MLNAGVYALLAAQALLSGVWNSTSVPRQAHFRFQAAVFRVVERSGLIGDLKRIVAVMDRETEAKARL